MCASVFMESLAGISVPILQEVLIFQEVLNRREVVILARASLFGVLCTS